MLTTTIKRTLATALSGAAIAALAGAPAASATPNLRPDALGAPGATQIIAPTPRSNAPSADQATPDAGLDLSSAAIGAASATGLLIVVLAAGALVWRRPIARRHGATGA